MAISSLTLPAPIRQRLSVAPRDFYRRDHAVELFEQGDALGGAIEALRYLLPGMEIGDLMSPLRLVQGTARVYVSVADDILTVRAHLAALGDPPSTAALRFFLTRISGTGQLYQPRLRGDQVVLEFSDRLSLVHPLKLIELMQRIAMEADNHDQWLIDAFGVTTPDREPLTALSDEEFERAWTIWQAHWEAVDALMVESRRRRIIRFLDALGAFAVNQVRYTLPLFGSIRQRLNDAADDFTDRDEDPSKRDAALSKCIKEMRAIGREELRANLGHARYAISPLHEGTPSLLTSMLGAGSRMQATSDLRAAGRALEASLELVADFLYLLAHHTWSAPIEQSLRQALDAVSDKPWREAADTLWSHANQIARTYGSHGEGEDDVDEAPGAEHAVTYQKAMNRGQGNEGPASPGSRRPSRERTPVMWRLSVAASPAIGAHL